MRQEEKETGEIPNFPKKSAHLAAEIFSSVEMFSGLTQPTRVTLKSNLIHSTSNKIFFKFNEIKDVLLSH